MRLIDADDLAAKIMIDAPDYLGSGSSITKAYILAMVKTTSASPTIDAVQVVRCKDCKYLIHHYGFMNDGYCEKISKLKPDPNWFCADGEKKHNDRIDNSDG